MVTATRNWVKSEDAGYRAGSTLLDGTGGHWSVYKTGSKWMAAWVVDQICRKSEKFSSRRAAMAFAESQV